jgi:CRP-like cAMP-binding protein
MPLASFVAELLEKNPLFGLLEQEARTAIARQMRPALFEPEQVIFSRGDAAKGIYLVAKGRVRLSVLASDGRVLSFHHAVPGDIFGEVATFDGGRRTADATAIERVEAMHLDRSAANGMIDACPLFSRAVIKFLCTRVRDTTEQIESIALHPVEIRLARFLLSALRMRGITPASKTLRLDLGMSQSELAQLIGASRQKVNAALATLERLGAIQRAQGLLTCDVEELSRIVEEL